LWFLIRAIWSLFPVRAFRDFRGPISFDPLPPPNDTEYLATHLISTSLLSSPEACPRKHSNTRHRGFFAITSDAQKEALNRALADIQASDEPAILKLIALMLNEASILGAETLRIYVKERSVITEQFSDDAWHPVESPPLYLWKEIVNIVVRYAGHEYWTKGSKKGKISRSELRDDWMLETNSQYEEILFYRVNEDES
jgi:hypothetical protein